MNDNNILQVENLKVHFKDAGFVARAVDGLSFNLAKGEVLAIVGESGCGKSVAVSSIMGLKRAKNTFISGSVKYNGRELTTITDEEYRLLRGRDFSIIFQEPMSSFDPLYTIGQQMIELIEVHLERMPKQAALELATTALKEVKIPAAESRLNEYPHEMSGGMLQRVLLAMALITKPNILIADEPTTALDVTIQAQILMLLKDIQSKRRMSVIFITHDLGVVGEISNNICVMYAGKMVEKTSTKKFFKKCYHPYSEGLLASRIKNEYKDKALPYIAGVVPSLYELGDGCPFYDRCKHRIRGKCDIEFPAMKSIEDGHDVACWLYADNNSNKGDA